MWILVAFWLLLAAIVRVVLKTVPYLTFGWRIMLWVAFVCFILFAFMAIGELSLFGVELVSTFPNTCKPSDDPNDGLCYDKCREGYHGVGPVCWADSVNVGTGKIASLGSCPSGWEDWGLLCHEPIRCASGLAFFTEGCSGGNLTAKPLECPGPTDKGATDQVSGLCYDPCPKHLPARIPGMPYLCYKGDSLSYGRGVGRMPSLLRFFGRFPVL